MEIFNGRVLVYISAENGKEGTGANGVYWLEHLRDTRAERTTTRVQVLTRH